MAEIKKFPNQSRYEELAIMEKEEFDKEIEKYEDHPKLKDLIENTEKHLPKDMRIWQGPP